MRKYKLSVNMYLKIKTVSSLGKKVSTYVRRKRLFSYKNSIYFLEYFFSSAYIVSGIDKLPLPVAIFMPGRISP